MNSYRHQVFSSILEIPKEQWDAIWPHPEESYNFFLSQEKGNFVGFEFLYLVIYSDETIVFIAPLFIMVFDLGIGLEGIGRSIARGIQRLWPRFLKMNTLFCGSPVTEKGIVAIHPDYRSDHSLIMALDGAMLAIAKEKKARLILFKDFMENDLVDLQPLTSFGYFLADSFPSTIIPIDFSSIDGYLAKLSYHTRKDLRRKIKKTKALGGLSIEIVHSIDHCADEMYQLYLNINNASSLQFELIGKEFFINIGHYMPEETKFFLYRAQGKLIGFNYCLARKDALEDKYMGLDYSVSKDYNLYFTSLLANVQWCIDNGKKYYILSQNGYPTKIRLGATLIPLKAILKHVDPLTNRVLNSTARFLEPKKNR